jgi:hypothetical protein
VKKHILTSHNIIHNVDVFQFAFVMYRSHPVCGNGSFWENQHDSLDFNDQ